MTLTVITIASGRTRHLRAHLAALRQSSIRPDEHVVVSIADPDVKTVVQQERSSAQVLEISRDPRNRLPLARARNVGATHALDRGADTLVFLDVDCLASPRLLERYRDAADASRSPMLLCGPVTYLPSPVDGAAATDCLALLNNPHHARPAPPDTAVLDAVDYDLFWSLSFALCASTWRSLPGFCEEYAGYGGEDTDFAWTARHRGVGLRWVGGADAYHQFHPVTNPPVEHLEDILDNAQVFYQRWRRWPMEGWLHAFESAGLVEYVSDGPRWERRRPLPRISP
jgi:GT2 family glycosyltransferase